LSHVNEESLGFDALHLSAVKEIANIGLGHAATALTDLTGKSFNISTPNVESVPVAQLCELLGGYESIVLSVYMPFEGDVEGHIAFLFPFESAQHLWKMLVGEAPESPMDLNDLHCSAMLESGNIINSHFLNAISDMTDLKMHATPPMISCDFAASVVAQIVIEAEMSDAIALAVETQIYEEDSNTTGYFLCIPTREGLNTIFNRIGLEGAA
jgi:chemotaxis protein CheC